MLSNYLIERKTVSKWPGTELLVNNYFPDNYADICRYAFNKETSSILCNSNENLFEWLEPNFPEDLTFYKNDRPIFVSITHEKDAYFEIDEADKNYFVSNSIHLGKS